MKKILTGALAIAALVAVPGMSYAATYAYVNTAGEVSSVEADTASAAMMTAPGIHMHSGVMMIDSGDSIVGDDVSGI